ncbi:MAG: Dyp-type peroxidase [Burkholderiales bacterium]|nr:Dyp-type peroxidase [Burkholderiales bacterium]
MHKELIQKSKALGGVSDLTLFAPIKPGLVPSLETVTYKTRIKRLLKALNAGRSASHEYALLRPFSDAVERVGKIHSVRVVVVEPQDLVLLAVTFDGSWQSYVRTLWEKVGPLLDVIFCNTVDYVTAVDNSYDAWAAWIDRVQSETNFFYGMPRLTVDDIEYLRRSEEISRADEKTLEANNLDYRNRGQLVTGMQTPTAEQRATDMRDRAGRALEALRLGLQALAVLYRLTDLYLPDSEDGKYLHRAVRDLLKEFLKLISDRRMNDELEERMEVRFARQLEWLKDDRRSFNGDVVPPRRLVRPLPRINPLLEADGKPGRIARDVQGGIIDGYKGITRGSLLLISLADAAGGAALLDYLILNVTTVEKQGRIENPNKREAEDELRINIAVTFDGMRLLGLSEAQLGMLPIEFQEGMEARASLLGDTHHNHPRRWHLPLAFMPADAKDQRVELSSVHLLVQIRGGVYFDQQRNDFCLRIGDIPGVRIVAEQTMRRIVKGNKVREHFGFADGLSQPTIVPYAHGKQPKQFQNQVHLGEFLYGHQNAAEPAPEPVDAQSRERLRWMKNGSFLVIRKLRQNVAGLRKIASDAADNTGRTTVTAELIEEKMMGRKKGGQSLAVRYRGNDFDYDHDPHGLRCPLHAHIRRANPRPDAYSVDFDPQVARFPHLVRRGMSYGPDYDPARNGTEDEERGLVFMAYNASIAEQFEVVQRWVSGGNSTGGYSGQSDPFLGVAGPEGKRTFRFEHGNRVVRVELDGPAEPLDDDWQPLVRLEWGLYALTPSISALRELLAVAQRQTQSRAVAWSVKEGAARIAELNRIEAESGADHALLAWKSVLEDPQAQDDFVSASVWAAIRESHGGALRTPYGVLVADRRLIMQVLTTPGERYSVCGYRERMKGSIGEIYLGMDGQSQDSEYERIASEVNGEVSKFTTLEAFDLARRETKRWIDSFVAGEEDLARKLKRKKWELHLEAREISDRVLAEVCRHWFGLSEDKEIFKEGSQTWAWEEGKPPRYPGHFTAPSRYFFQPWPSRDVERLGRRYGQSLTTAFEAFLRPYFPPGCSSASYPLTPDNAPAPLARAIIDAARKNSWPLETVARVFVGVIMGFVPTIDGNFRLILNEWLKDGTFWKMRNLAAELSTESPAEKQLKFMDKCVLPTLKRTMQLRPSPELIWRTATTFDRIGDVSVRPGDMIVLSLVSATQQCLEHDDGGKPDVYPVFGGDRKANPHPTHACPGYAAAMGLLQGMMFAFLRAPGNMRPNPAPGAFSFDGAV